MKDKFVNIWRLTALLPTVSQWVDDEDFGLIQQLSEAQGESFFLTLLPEYGKSIELHAEMCATRIEPGWSDLEGFLDSVPILRRAFRRARQGHCHDSLYAIGNLERPTDDTEYRAFCEETAAATRAIRQLTLLFYKLEVEPTHDQKINTWSAFVETDTELSRLNLTDTFQKKNVLNEARKLIRSVLGRFDASEVIGFHGSGTSACGVKPHLRYGSERVVHELNSVFPYDQYFCVNDHHMEDIGRLDAPFTGGLPGFSYLTYLEDRNDEIRNVDQLLGDAGTSVSRRRIHTTQFVSLAELSSKVEFVSKNMKGPRLISEEPRELMYIQQGIRVLMDKRIKRSLWASDLVLDDQVRQKVLARLSSLNRKLATLDMKEASDRVSLTLVKALFPHDWYCALLACRSPRTTFKDTSGEVPVVHVCEFAKFAPMGSALCFPVEQLVFWALCRAIVGRPASHVSVFGDDIIIETTQFAAVVEGLEAFGLKTNVSKSFAAGFLRESCGGYYYGGHDISHVGLKQPPTDDYDGYSGVIAYLNNLFGKYYHATGFYKGSYFPMFRNTCDEVLVSTWEVEAARFLIETFAVDHIPFALASEYDVAREEHCSRSGSPFIVLGNPQVLSCEALGLENDPIVSRTTLCESMVARGGTRRYRTYVREPVRVNIPECGWSLLQRWFSKTELVPTDFHNVLEESLFRDSWARYQPGLPIREYDPCGYVVEPPLPVSQPKGNQAARPRLTSVSHAVASRLFKYVKRTVQA